MAEQELDGAQRHTLFVQMGGVGATQVVGRRHTDEAGAGAHRDEPTTHRAGADRPVVVARIGISADVAGPGVGVRRWKRPGLARPAGPPVVGEHVQHVLRQGHRPRLATLRARDVEQSVGPIDVRDLDDAGLTHPHAGAIEQAEEGVVERVLGLGEQSLDLDVAAGRPGLGDVLERLGAVQDVLVQSPPA